MNRLGPVGEKATEHLPEDNEFERRLAALRTLVADIARTIASEESSLAPHSSELTDAAQALFRLRDSIVPHLRSPNALRIERRPSPR